MIILMFITALALSGAAAFYAIVGLMAIFAAAPIPIAIMGSLLEGSKLVVASWLYRNWKEIPILLKSYFVVALIILMSLTSMGIFGFLSKSHLDQAVPTGEISAKVADIDEQINIEKEKINEARKNLAQLDSQVDQTISRTSSQQDDDGVRRSIRIRKQQSKERTTLREDISSAQKKISQLSEEKRPYSTELRKVEAEVGPIKYIAALIYGETDQTILEKAVRVVIMMIVVVFDPLAVLMLIAANWSLVHRKKDDNDAPPKEVESSLSIPSDKTPSHRRRRSTRRSIQTGSESTESAEKIDDSWQTPPPPTEQSWVSRPHT